MDFASFIGIIAGISLIVSAIFMGGNASEFINVPGMMIVVGGTIAATILTFPVRDIWDGIRGAFRVFTHSKQTPQDMIQTMIELCTLSRQRGLIALADLDTNSSFLKRAANLIADAATEEALQHVLRTEINSLKARHFVVQNIFRKMAIYAPSFGMLGTLIGLIQMLSRMDDPDVIGPAMAVALLTTFYGSMMATMIFLPIAGKLKARTMEEIMNLEIIYNGAHSIMIGDHPIILYEKLSSFLPERRRPTLQRKKSGKKKKKAE